MLADYWKSLAGSGNRPFQINFGLGGVQWLICIPVSFEEYLETVQVLAGAIGLFLSMITMICFAFYGGIAVLYFPFWLLRKKKNSNF